MNQDREVTLKNGKVVRVTGPIRRIPAVDVPYDSLILPKVYSGGGHSAVDSDPEDDPGMTYFEVPDPELNPEEAFIAREEIERKLDPLYDAMNTRLTKRERDVLDAKIGTEKTDAEIARELGVSEDGAKEAYRRAIRKLRKVAGVA